MKRLSLSEVLEHEWLKGVEESLYCEINQNNKFKLKKRVSESKLKILERIYAKHKYSNEALLGVPVKKSDFDLIEPFLQNNGLQWKCKDNVIKCKTEDESLMIEIHFYDLDENRFLFDFQLKSGNTLKFLHLINNIRSSFEINNSL